MKKVSNLEDVTITSLVMITTILPSFVLRLWSKIGLTAIPSKHFLKSNIAWFSTDIYCIIFIILSIIVICFEVFHIFLEGSDDTSNSSRKPLRFILGRDTWGRPDWAFVDFYRAYGMPIFEHVQNWFITNLITHIIQIEWAHHPPITSSWLTIACKTLTIILGFSPKDLSTRKNML